jgi:hypothetical protein
MIKNEFGINLARFKANEKTTKVKNSLISFNDYQKTNSVILIF